MTKFCKDCKHVDKVMGVLWCEHPSLGISSVYGDINTTRCTTMRDRTCGEEAKLFEPKPTLKEKIWHLLKLT